MTGRGAGRRRRATRAVRNSEPAAGRARRTAPPRWRWSATARPGARRHGRSGTRPWPSGRRRTRRRRAPSSTDSASRAQGGGARATSLRRVAVTWPPPPSARRSRVPRRARRLDPPAVRCRAHVRSRAPCAGLRAARSRSAMVSAVAASTFAVGSSSTTSGARRTSARAMAMRCRWPAETARPPSPTTVSYPCSRSRMNASAPARRAASRTASKGADGRPSRMLSRTDPRKSVGRCGTHATDRRHAAMSHRARSTPPTVTRPAVGSTSPRMTAAIVLFPLPVGPTSATTSPGRSSRPTSLRTGAGRAG